MYECLIINETQTELIDVPLIVHNNQYFSSSITLITMLMSNKYWIIPSQRYLIYVNTNYTLNDRQKYRASSHKKDFYRRSFTDRSVSRTLVLISLSLSLFLSRFLYLSFSILLLLYLPWKIIIVYAFKHTNKEQKGKFIQSPRNILLYGRPCLVQSRRTLHVIWCKFVVLHLQVFFPRSFFSLNHFFFIFSDNGHWRNYAESEWFQKYIRSSLISIEIRAKDMQLYTKHNILMTWDYRQKQCWN